MQIPSYISTRLHYQHKSLIDTIDGLSDEQVRRQIITGKWSIFEHMVHLQTYQHIFIVRVHKILTGNSPSFPRYSAEADPMFLENCSLSTREIMQDLITTRKEMATEMVQFAETDFTKTAEHPAFGPMNLLQWMNFFLLHEGHHLFAVFKLTAELKKESGR
jgi:uncharacterized damage-inducible protein DinB